MATNLLWTSYAAAAAELLDSDNLNSLADGCLASANESSDTITTSIDNTSNLYTFVDVGIVLASLNITAPGTVDIVLLPLNMDGSTWPYFAVDHSTSGNNKVPLHNGVYSASFQVKNGAQSQLIERVPIGPTKYLAVVKNNTGVALASSGNHAYYRAYTAQSA